MKIRCNHLMTVAATSRYSHRMLNWHNLIKFIPFLLYANCQQVGVRWNAPKRNKKHLMLLFPGFHLNCQTYIIGCIKYTSTYHWSTNAINRLFPDKLFWQPCYAINIQSIFVFRTTIQIEWFQECINLIRYAYMCTKAH